MTMLVSVLTTLGCQAYVDVTHNHIRFRASGDNATP